jgi:hypothetical protein
MNDDLNKPILFNLRIEKERDDFVKFRNENIDVSYVDTLGEQENELSLVKDPSLVSHVTLDSGNKFEVEDNSGIWAYFPWKKTAIRILDENEYSLLRLSRNYNLITPKEEKILANVTLAVAGLNVGNPGAICLALEGIGNNIKLADFDLLSVSNLNRFRAGLPDIGINKAVLSARQMYEINPFLNIEVYDIGITPENMESFLISPKIDLLVEETDNLKLKINIRNMAKKYKIPVLMVTGNGDNVLVDIERYDLDENLPILSGYLSSDLINKIQSVEKGKGSFEERVILARDFIGKEYLASRLVDSFSEVGKTLAGIPQLAESSFLRGAVICHFVKKILLKEEVLSGRYKVLLDGVKI